MLKESGEIGIGIENYCALDIKDDRFRILKSKEEAKVLKMYYLKNEYIEEALRNEEYENIDKLTSR